MPASSRKATRWKPVALLSAALVSLCLAVGYIDVGTRFRFDFFTEYYGTIFVVGACAALSGCVAVIAWGRHLGRVGRAWLAITVLAWPWAMLLIGYPVAGTNIHGPAVPVMLLIVPAAIVSLVLFAMAGAAARNT